MAMGRRVAARHEVLELALDVGQQRTGPKPEQRRPEPAVAELFLHKDEPIERLLGSADATGRLEPDRRPGPQLVFTDHARHDDAHRQHRVDRFLARGRLDEIGAGHHRHHAGAGDIRECRQVAGAEDRLHVRAAAGIAERADLGVERRPVAGQDIRARDDDVDLLRARRNGRLDLLEPLREGTESRGEAGRYGGHRNPRAFERRDRSGDERVIDADRANLDIEIADAERVDQVLAQRATGLGAEPQHVAGRVVALQRRQVHAGDRAQQPRGLPFLLYGTARWDGGGAAFHGAAIDAQRADDVEIERQTGIAIVLEDRTNWYAPSPQPFRESLHAGGRMRTAAGKVNATPGLPRPSGTP